MFLFIPRLKQSYQCFRLVYGFKLTSIMSVRCCIKWWLFLLFNVNPQINTMSFLRSLPSGLNKTTKLISRSVPAVSYHPNVGIYLCYLIFDHKQFWRMYCVTFSNQYSIQSIYLLLEYIRRMYDLRVYKLDAIIF